MFKAKFLLVMLPAFLISGIAFSTPTTTSNTASQSETTGQYVKDTAITTKVKSELMTSKDIKSLSISVVTDKGIVTLSGNVENAMQKKKAVKIAMHVKGVKSVKDELVVNAAK